MVLIHSVKFGELSADSARANLQATIRAVQTGGFLFFTRIDSELLMDGSKLFSKKLFEIRPFTFRNVQCVKEAVPGSEAKRNAKSRLQGPYGWKRKTKDGLSVRA